MSTPAPTPSTTYKSLSKTALAFLLAQRQTAPPTSPAHQRMNFPLLRSLCAPNFSHSWGHKFAVAQSPPLQGMLGVEEFVAHLMGMVGRVEGWRVDVGEDGGYGVVGVDEVKRVVVVRVGVTMVVGGGEVENDILWVVEMDGGTETGEVRVRRSTEFIDGVAAGRIRELIVGVAKSA